MSDDGSSHAWILGVASVVFDTDEGQKVEYIYPWDALSKAEEHDVAFHAFPVGAHIAEVLPGSCGKGFPWLYGVEVDASARPEVKRRARLLDTYFRVECDRDR